MSHLVATGSIGPTLVLTPPKPLTYHQVERVRTGRRCGSGDRCRFVSFVVVVVVVVDVLLLGRRWRRASRVPVQFATAIAPHSTAKRSPWLRQANGNGRDVRARTHTHTHTHTHKKRPNKQKQPHNESAEYRTTRNEQQSPRTMRRRRRRKKKKKMMMMMKMTDIVVMPTARSGFIKFCSPLLSLSYLPFFYLFLEFYWVLLGFTGLWLVYG